MKKLSSYQKLKLQLVEAKTVIQLMEKAITEDDYFQLEQIKSRVKFGSYIDRALWFGDRDKIKEDRNNPHQAGMIYGGITYPLRHKECHNPIESWIVCSNKSIKLFARQGG